MTTIYFRWACVTWLAVSLLSGCVSNPHSTADEAAVADENRPLIAIWCDSTGYAMDSQAPYLRVAIWKDGRIVFSQDPGKWSHDLKQGRISSGQLAGLEQAIKASGVFELKGNCYLVPSAPVDCLMIDMGDQRQMLYWDEQETPGYGINISPKPQHLEFKKCWKEVNRLALAVIPQQSEPYQENFQRPPQSWRLKKPIQSE